MSSLLGFDRPAMAADQRVIIHTHQAVPKIDFDAADKWFWPTPGGFVLEMLPAPAFSSVANLEIPASSEGKVSPDVGVVIAVAPNVPLLLGDVVAVKPMYGKRVGGLACPGYVSKGGVRIYGVVSLTTAVPRRHDWREAVVGTFPDLQEGDLIALERFTPQGRRLLVRRKSHERTDSGVELPDSATLFQIQGEVLKVAPNCGADFHGCVGKQIVARFDNAMQLAGFGVDERDLFLVPEGDVWASWDGQTVKPLGKHVLIKRSEVVQRSSGGVHLPDGQQYRTSRSNVIAVGESAESVFVGDWVMYQSTLVREVARSLMIDPALAILHCDAIQLCIGKREDE